MSPWLFRPRHKRHKSSQLFFYVKSKIDRVLEASGMTVIKQGFEKRVS